MGSTTLNEHNGHQNALDYLHRKAWGAGIAFLLILGALGLRLWDLQLRQGAYYYGQAQAEALRPIIIPASRGEILDSTGTVLAEDVPSFTATLSYTPAPLSPAEVQLLGTILNIAPQQIETAEGSLRAGSTAQPFAPAILRTGLSPEQYTAIEQNLTGLPGVNVQAQPVRSYPGIPGDANPGPELAANIIGTVQQGAVAGDVSGSAGIESTFNQLEPSLHSSALGLAGLDGQELMEVDTASHPVRQVAVQAPVPGNNVVLTLNAGLQAVAQQAIAAQLTALRTRSFGSDGGPFPDAHWGAAVAIDVHSGAILAMASVPTVDPNAFAEAAVAPPGSAARDQFNTQYTAWASDSLGDPFLDHAIDGAFAPGSTFKPITAIAALQNGVITPSTHLNCPASVRVGNTVLTNWIAPEWGGNLDLEEAIGRSCDTYFYEVGNEVGVSAIDAVASEFGLGQKTGLWELPGESVGTLSSPQAYASLYHAPWNTDLTMQTAIGQGLNGFTVLQMADYVAALANGGTLYRPYLVSAVVNSATGKAVWTQQPQVRNQIPLSSEIVNAIHQALDSVTQCDPAWALDGADSTCGTAYWSFYNFSAETKQYLGPSIAVAGKTGTAQTSLTGTPNGWWISWAPADNPQIAIVVETDASGEGFVGGAPIAREMFDYYFGLDQAMWKAGAASQIIPAEIQQYFGLAQHYPDWWGPAPAPPPTGAAAKASALAAGGSSVPAPPAAVVAAPATVAAPAVVAAP